MTRNSLRNVFSLIEQAKESQSVETSFLNDLRRSIELTEEKNARKPSQTYKPSSMNCLRNMWFQVTGTEPDVSNASACLVGICESGTDRHERVQNAVLEMRSNNIDCEYVDVEKYVKSRNLDYLNVIEKKGNETKLYHKSLNLSFLCDGIIRYKGKYYILEIKTESIYKWQNRQGVNEAHYNQATAYSIALGLDDIIFLYINRDNTDMKAFMFHVTEEMKQTLVGKIETCDDYVKKLTCPPKPENAGAKLCQYCNYRNSCRRCE